MLVYFSKIHKCTESSESGHWLTLERFFFMLVNTKTCSLRICYAKVLIHEILYTDTQTSIAFTV